MSVLEIREGAIGGTVRCLQKRIVICLRALARHYAETMHADDARPAMLLQKGEE